MTIENLEKELGQGNLNSLYLLYGEEEYLLETSVKKIKKLFGTILPGINYILLDETNVNRIIEEIETPAFGFEKKLIIVKSSSLFKKETKTKSKSNNLLSDKIAEYIEKSIKFIKETSIILFIEKEIGKTNLASVIEKNGVTCNFEKLKPAQISRKT